MKNLLLASAMFLLGSAAQASVITYGGFLSGANENLPVNSPATGTVFVTIDNVANTITFNVSFSGLTANDSAAHIHCCTPLGGNTGVATIMPAFPGFPLGVTSGTFNNAMFSLLDPAFYNPTYITNNGGTAATAAAALEAGIAAGQAYFNIHTGNFPGGEVRAFLLTPEPASFVLAGLALVGLALCRRRTA